MTDKLMHTFAVDAGDLEEKREIAGLAAPYGETITHAGKKVRFEKGMFAGADGVHLYFNHEEGLPIGLVTEFEDTDEGLKIRARISKTAKGEEVYTLLRDGVLNKFSVGFIGLESRMDDDVSVWTKVDLHEVSVVPRPAFKTAAVASVHSADSTNESELNDNTMSDILTNEVGELKEAFSDLERKVVALGTAAPAVEVKTEKYNSGAEALKGVYSGADAKEAFAYTGSTLATNDAATRPAWLQRELKIVEAKRPVSNLFRKGALPATGMSYTYPQVSGVTGAVAKHVEGADLPFLGASVGTATASIDVWGGHTQLTRELIDRSDVPLLELHLRHLFNEYAKATEKAVKDKFVAATGVQTATLAANTAAGWLAVALDGAAKIEDNALGAVAEYIVVSRDVFAGLVGILDTTNRPVFDLNGDGANTIGNLSLVRTAGTIGGFPVVVVPSLAANSMFIVSSEAITVRGDEVPRSLQDENIINLTKAFAVYGYQAVELSNPSAIVKVTKA